MHEYGASFTTRSCRADIVMMGCLIDMIDSISFTNTEEFEMTVIGSLSASGLPRSKHTLQVSIMICAFAHRFQVVSCILMSASQDV